MKFKSLRMLRYVLILISISFIYCSSETEGNREEDGSGGSPRVCKNSAQCKPDEECVNSMCVKKVPKDAEYDSVDDISFDVLIDGGSDIGDGDLYDGGMDVGDETDILDVEVWYNIGIMSVYEGAVGECRNEEYLLKSVSGYSGVGVMNNEEYTINVGARFK